MRLMGDVYVPRNYSAKVMGGREQVRNPLLRNSTNQIGDVCGVMSRSRAERKAPDGMHFERGDKMNVSGY
jgi:hypothetical protein